MGQTPQDAARHFSRTSHCTGRAFMTVAPMACPIFCTRRNERLSHFALRSEKWLGVRSCTSGSRARPLNRLTATSFSPTHPSTRSQRLAARRQTSTLKTPSPAQATARSATIPRMVSRCSPMILSRSAVLLNAPTISFIGPKCLRGVTLRRMTRLICWWLISGNSLNK